MKTEEIVGWLIKNRPDTNGSNTEIYIAMMEGYCQNRGVVIPAEVVEFMRKYKPESVMRKRRELVASTEAQLAEAQKYHDYYADRIT